MPTESPTDRYFRQKLRAQHKRTAIRAVGTTACCGLPCLLLVLGVAAIGLVLLLA